MSDFDLLVDEAWPAPYRVAAGDWVHRHAGGVTKRANSVLPLGERPDLGRAIDEAEAFYRELGRPCVFSIGGGATPGLDAELESRGYRLVDPTLVMTRPSLPSGETLPVTALDGAADLTIAQEPSPGWADTWWRVDGGRHPQDTEISAKEWGVRILTGVPAAYASLGEDAVGRAVRQGEWIGIYRMAVVPEARRRGLGGAVLRGLLGWGRAQGASRAYLVVTEANEGARALYEREGFTVAGRYHYRVR
ncbi:GNAT family N-acetyltransferase [Microtetraspora sp. NBRC 16547]|uniref:GNAT family N-acetyltransferase n=1 Tax=Microtetraspora sp. NBRC 16547 TaxID=3030993 RepID=UPI0024A2CCC0|nr:GNAT family N-acetyltransferase [Microtetraspora sp. NBRC 16547]GLX00798.1 acetyltransferase [Microtetraspora sp. NBRC 16547]